MLDATQFISTAGLLTAFAVIPLTVLAIGFIRRIIF